MVQSVNPEFERAQGSQQREPQYSLVLWSGDDELTITSHTIAGITSPQVLQGRITNISGWTQGIDADAFFTTTGQIQVGIRDVDGALADAIATRREAGTGLRSQRAVVLRGDRDLAYDKFVPAVTYRVEDYRSFDGEVTLTLADIQRGLDDTIMVPHTARLRMSITENQTHVPVLLANAANQFPLVRRGPNYRYQLGVNDWGIINVDGEWMIHKGTITHPDDGLSFDILMRGAFYSVNREHEVDTERPSDEWPEIREVFYLEAPAVQILYALLTGELYGQVATLPPHWHLGLPSSWVRLTDFLNIGTDIWNPVSNTGRMAVLNGEENLNAKQYIDEQLNPIINGVMMVYNSGDLGLRRRRTPTAGSAADVTLTVNEIISAGDVHWAQQNVINHYLVQWDYDPVNERFRQNTEATDAAAAIDGKSALRTIPLRTVQNTKTGTTEVLEYIDELRDRTANPPLLWRVQISPRLDNLEVGDTVRVVYPYNTDPTTGEPINRSFEVLQIENNWQEGQVYLNLYGATGRSQPIARTLATELLNDAFYSQGTNLASVLSINASGEITANGTLSGANTLSGGVYYYDGDLTLPAGRTITIERNVWLRIKGFFDLQGTIDGKGNAQIASGTPGVFGSTRSGQNLIASPGVPFTAFDGNAVKGDFDVMPRNALTNNNGVLELPLNDLRGTPGAPSDAFNDPLSPSTVLIPSRLGGAAGAGLAITCRGMQAQGGKIDLSGEDGLAGEYVFYSYPLSSIRYLYGGSSAGGCPGCCLVSIDGFNAMPTLDDVIVSRYGISPQTPEPLNYNSQWPPINLWPKSWGTMLPAQDGTAPLGGQASYMRAYVPNLPTVKPYDPIIDPPQPTSITLQKLANTPPTPAKDRVTIEVNINLGGDPAIASVDLYVRKNTGPWEFLQRAITAASFERRATADTYWVQARAVDTQGRVAKDGPTDSVTLETVADAKDPALVPSPSLSASVQSNGIRISQNLGPEYDVELREGSTWANAARVITGRWTEHLVGRRAPGNHTFLAKGINAAGTYSTATASITVTVNQLALPTIGVRPGIGSVTITLENTDSLVQGHKVWLSTNNGFNPDMLTPDYQGPDTAITLADLDLGERYYLRVRPYSEYGDSSNTSTQFTFDTLAPAVDLDGAELSAGEILIVNGILQTIDPGTGYEANWGVHTLGGTAYLLTYRDELGNVITSVESDGHLRSTSFTFGDESNGESITFNSGQLVFGENATIGNNTNRTLTVGVGGDYATLNVALEALSRVVPAYKPGGFTAVVSMLEGYVINEAVDLVGLNLGWIRIESENDTIIDIHGTNMGLSNNPAFKASGSATFPIINVRFRLVSAPSGALKPMFLATNNSSLSFQYRDDLSTKLSQQYSKSGDCIVADDNSRITFKNGLVINANNAFLADNNSNIDANRTSTKNTNIASSSDNSSTINIDNGDFEDTAQAGISSKNSSRHSGQNCTLSGIKPDIGALYEDSASGSVAGCSFNGCELNGIQVNHASIVDASSGNFRTGLGDSAQDIVVNFGGIIGARFASGGTNITPNSTPNANGFIMK